MMAFGPAIINAVKAIRTHIGAPTYAISVSNSKPLLAALGEEARGIAFTTTVPYPWQRSTPLTRDFAAAMERKSIPIDYDHMFGYFNMRVLLEALKRSARQLTSDGLVPNDAGYEKMAPLAEKAIAEALK